MKDNTEQWPNHRENKFKLQEEENTIDERVNKKRDLEEEIITQRETQAI